MSNKENLQSAKNILFAFRMGSVVYLTLPAVLFSLEGFAPLALALLLALAAVWMVFYSDILADYRRAKDLVCFGEISGNIYIFSRSAKDATLKDRANEIIMLLRESGNKNQVIVKVIEFQSPSYIETWLDSAGARRTAKFWRETDAAYEDWEDYMAFCDGLVEKDLRAGVTANFKVTENQKN